MRYLNFWKISPIPCWEEHHGIVKWRTLAGSESKLLFTSNGTKGLWSVSRLIKWIPDDIICEFPHAQVRASSLDSDDSGICQKPLYALKTLAPAIALAVLNCWNYLWTLSFRGLRFTHTRTLGTTTMPAHQGVGFLTLDITLTYSMRWSSFP